MSSKTYTNAILTVCMAYLKLASTILAIVYNFWDNTSINAIQHAPKKVFLELHELSSEIILPNIVNKLIAGHELTKANHESISTLPDVTVPTQTPHLELELMHHAPTQTRTL